MITIKSSGEFKNTTKYLKKIQKALKKGIFDKYGEKGVEALSAATPKDTGLTARSWGYTIIQANDIVRIAFTNSNTSYGVPVALVIQYGHATRNGGYIEGRDYINPAIQPVFDKMIKEVWGEITVL